MGSVVENPPEAFDQAVAVAQALTSQRTPFEDVVFGVFLAGHDVDLAVIRAAYRISIEKNQAMVRKELDPNPSPEDFRRVVTGIAAMDPSALSPLNRLLRDTGTGKGEFDSILELVVSIYLGKSIDKFNYASLPDETSALDTLLTRTGLLDPGAPDAEARRDDLIDAMDGIGEADLLPTSQEISYERLVRLRDLSQTALSAVEGTEDSRAAAVEALPDRPSDIAISLLMADQSLRNHGMTLDEIEQKLRQVNAEQAKEEITDDR